jgi:hypothetical protein
MWAIIPSGMADASPARAATERIEAFMMSEYSKDKSYGLDGVLSNCKGGSL